LGSLAQPAAAIFLSPLKNALARHPVPLSVSSYVQFILGAVWFQSLLFFIVNNVKYSQQLLFS
jgi:hypothetical protein